MNVDRGAIDRQLREIGEGELWWEQREFRDLPHILNSEERIRAVVQGKLLGARRPRIRPARRWLVVVTDQRLICLKQERFGRTQIDMTAGVITRVDQRSRLRSFQVTFAAGGRRYRLRIAKADAFRFTRAIEPLLPRHPVRRNATPIPSSISWIPGITTVAALPGMDRIVSGVALFSPPDTEFATRGHLERVESTVDGLQAEVEKLREQVEFLEALLQERAGTDRAGAEAGRDPGAGANRDPGADRGNRAVTSAGTGAGTTDRGGADTAAGS